MSISILEVMITLYTFIEVSSILLLVINLPKLSFTEVNHPFLSGNALVCNVDGVNFFIVMTDMLFLSSRRALFQASVVSVGQTDLSSVVRKPMEISNIFKMKRDCFINEAK